MESEKNIEGLGGWLILVALGIIISPIKIISFLLPLKKDIFDSGFWEMATTPGSEFYNTLWKPILLNEIGINILLIAAWIYIAYLFFSKKKLFPKVYMSVMIFTLLFIILDAFAVKLVLPDEPIFDPETTKEVVQTLVACIIWIPYMLLSKRVKATFVN